MVRELSEARQAQVAWRAAGGETAALAAGDASAASASPPPRAAEGAWERIGVFADWRLVSRVERATRRGAGYAEKPTDRWSARCATGRAYVLPPSRCRSASGGPCRPRRCLLSCASPEAPRAVQGRGGIACGSRCRLVAAAHVPSKPAVLAAHRRMLREAAKLEVKRALRRGSSAGGGAGGGGGGAGGGGAGGGGGYTTRRYQGRARWRGRRAATLRHARLATRPRSLRPLHRDGRSMLAGGPARGHGRPSARDCRAAHCRVDLARKPTAAAHQGRVICSQREALCLH